MLNMTVHDRIMSNYGLMNYDCVIKDEIGQLILVDASGPWIVIFQRNPCSKNQEVTGSLSRFLPLWLPASQIALHKW